MRLYKLLFPLLALAAVSTAQAALPSSVGKAKQVLTVTQKVSPAGEAQVTAKVAPLVNATAGYGTTVLRTDVRIPSAIGSIQTLKFPVPVSQQVTLDTATAHFKQYAEPLAGQMQVWMKANGVSFAWFSYEQTVNVRVAQYAGSGGASGGGGASRPSTKYQNYLIAVDGSEGSGGGGVSNTGGLAPGVEERLLLWTMSTDQNGRLLYGKPKLVPPRPKTLYIVYTPKTVDDELPAVAAYPNAGTLFVQTRDEAFSVIPGTNQYIDTNGAFDEDTKNFPVDNPDTPDVDESLNYSDNEEYASKVKCLMTTGCGVMYDGAPLSVQRLMDDRGATLAIVEYVHKVQPAYETTPDANGNYQPISNRLVIDKRTVTYNGCNDPVYYNKGHYGFSLRSSLTRYIVASDGQYAPLAEVQGEVIGVNSEDDKHYEGSVTVASADISKLASYVINPANPTSKELLPLSKLAVTSAVPDVEKVGDDKPVTIYSTTPYIGTGSNQLNAHLFLQCSSDSPLIRFSAGWQDNGANASVNWQPQVNRYTMGTTFTKGTAASKQVWTREDPSRDICYGTASYDGNRTVSLSMSGSCAWGTQLLHGNVDSVDAGSSGWYYGYGADTWQSYYTGITIGYGYLENGLGSLFSSTCPAGTTYGQVSGSVFAVSYQGGGGDSGGGYVPQLLPQARTGCLYDSRAGLHVSQRDLLVYGPVPAGSSGWGQDGNSWPWLGVCPTASDRPVFTASDGYYYGGDSGGEDFWFTARTCVMKPQSTYRVSW